MVSIHTSTLLRVAFCISWLLFIFAILSPQLHIAYGIIPHYPGYDWEEFHHSFQAARFPAGTFGWDFYFSPHKVWCWGIFGSVETYFIMDSLLDGSTCSYFKYQPFFQGFMFWFGDGKKSIIC